MIDKKNITGIILAGGKSSRMGSDKGFLLLNKKPFIQHIIDALNPLVTEIVIVSNRIEYNGFKLKRVTDYIENSGPLAGVYSGLNSSETDYNIVLSCDIPLISTEILKKLIKNSDTISEVIQIESEGKTMPLIALYKKECKYKFYKLLEKGERRLQYAVEQCVTKNIILDKKNSAFVANINTPKELKEIKDAYND